MKNAMQLKAILKNMAKQKNISAQLVLQNYMLERLLERVSVSKYRNNFILKGGFLIAAMVGLDTRATMDMDATLKGYPVNEETVRKMFEEICAIELNDDVTFAFRQIGEIREGDEYTGYRVALTANYPPLAVPLKLDTRNLRTHFRNTMQSSWNKSSSNTPSTIDSFRRSGRYIKSSSVSASLSPDFARSNRSLKFILLTPFQRVPQFFHCTVVNCRNAFFAYTEFLGNLLETLFLQHPGKEDIPFFLTDVPDGLNEYFVFKERLDLETVLGKDQFVLIGDLLSFQPCNLSTDKIDPCIAHGKGQIRCKLVLQYVVLI